MYFHQLEKLLYFSIFIFPIQILHIKVKSTSIDISSLIILLVLIFAILKTELKYNKNTLIYYSIFLLLELVIFLFSPAPIVRFFSSLIWISLTFILIFGKKLFILDYSFIEKLLKIAMLIAALLCWYQYFIIIGPERYNLGVKLRSSALFMEPSYAGLALYAMSLSYLSSFIYRNEKITNLCFSIFYFATGILTLSMHVVTFLLIISLVILYYLKNKFSYKTFFYFLSISFFLLLLTYLLIFVIDFDFVRVFTNHFMRRIDVFNLETSSLSLLAWIMGFDQMIKSFDYNVILGLGVGLGSTGEFFFESNAKNILNSYGSGDLTLKDAYSLFYRLVIEIGLIITLIFIAYIFIKTHYFLKTIDKKKIESLFCFIFSLTIIIGSLIKEPNLSRSSLIIAILIFTTISIKKIKKND